METDIYYTENDSHLSTNPLKGLLFKARMYSMIDKTSDSEDSFSGKGLSKPMYDTIIGLLEKINSPRFNKDLIEAYNYLKYYYYAQFEKELKLNEISAKQNLEKSIYYAEKIVTIDPSDTYALKGLENLKKILHEKISSMS